jgi:hypothetical protein
VKIYQNHGVNTMNHLKLKNKQDQKEFCILQKAHGILSGCETIEHFTCARNWLTLALNQVKSTPTILMIQDIRRQCNCLKYNRYFGSLRSRRIYPQ